MNKISKIYNAIRRPAREYSRLVILSFISILLLFATLISFYEADLKNTPKEKSIIPKFVETTQLNDDKLFINSVGILQNINVITIKSTTSGIAGKLKVGLGDNISKEEKLVEIKESASGDSSFDIQREIGTREINAAKELLEYFQEIETDINNIEKAKIIDLDEKEEFKEDQLNDLDTVIDQIDLIIEDIEVNSQITTTEIKIIIVQLKEKLAELKHQREILEYETSSKYPEGKIANAEKNITNEDIKYQIKNAKLAVDIAELKYELIDIQEDIRTIISPIDGTVEDIMINQGQTIELGQDLMIISGKIELNVQLKVTPEVSKLINASEKAFIQIDDEKIECDIEFISDIPLEGNLFEINVKPDKDILDKLPLGSTVNISLPMSPSGNDFSNILVPVDSVFNSNNTESIFIVENNLVVEKKIKTGDIVGNYITVLEGLEGNELIILTRDIFPGDSVTIGDTLIEDTNVSETEENEE